MVRIAAGRRTNEDDPGRRAAFGEIGVLGQEPIARMQALGAAFRASARMASWSR